MIQIRDYQTSDYEGLKANLEAAHMFDPEWDTKDNLKRKLAKYPGSILVAVDDGTVVGNVYIVGDNFQTIIFRLAVKEDYRKQGIGSRLMDEAERRMKENGINHVALLVREGEEKTVAWYKKRGYYPAGSRHQVMHKKLF